jgi:hypothetical protein
MDEVYKVILPSYLASGGDGFQMIKKELLKHDSGKHRVSLSLSQRYSGRTELGGEGELLVVPGGQSQKTHPVPLLLSPSCFACSKTETHHLVIPFPSPAHGHIQPAPGQICF